MNLCVNVKVSPSEIKEIEQHFFGFQIERTSIEESLKEFALSMLSVDYTKPRSDTNRNGTEWAVINAVDKKSIAERWGMVVRNTYDRFRFDDQKRKFIELYYFKIKSVRQVCMSLFISDRSFCNYRKEVATIAKLWAIDLNLMGENE